MTQQEIYDAQAFEDCVNVEKLLDFMKSMNLDLIQDFVFKFNNRTFRIKPTV